MGAWFRWPRRGLASKSGRANWVDVEINNGILELRQDGSREIGMHKLWAFKDQIQIPLISGRCSIDPIAQCIESPHERRFWGWTGKIRRSGIRRNEHRGCKQIPDLGLARRAMQV